MIGTIVSVYFILSIACTAGICFYWYVTMTFENVLVVATQMLGGNEELARIAVKIGIAKDIVKIFFFWPIKVPLLIIEKYKKY